jgi:hypothetical protein
LLRREEGTEDALAMRGVDAGAVVCDVEAQKARLAIDFAVDLDGRHDAGFVTGFDRIASQVADRLAQQHLVAIDGGPRAADVHASSEPLGVGADVVGHALGERLHGDGAHGELRRPREVQEVGHNLPQRVGLGAQAFDVRPLRARERVEIEQARVAVNGRQPFLNSCASPAVSSPSRASVSFRRSWSSRSAIFDRSVNRQFTPLVTPAVADQR